MGVCIFGWVLHPGKKGQKVGGHEEGERDEVDSGGKCEWVAFRAASG